MAKKKIDKANGEKSQRQLAKETLVETLRHQEVFEIYYAMGDARSLRNLSDIVGTAYKTLETWSSVFKWQDRVAQRDTELIKRIQEDFKDEVLKYRCFYIEVVKEMISDCFEVDEKTKKRKINIKATSVADIERLVKLHMSLMGDTGSPLGGDGSGGGGGGGGTNVTIVMPQQLEENEWEKMAQSRVLRIS